MKVATWNVNGIRAREAQFLELVREERADVICLQETKASPDQLSDALLALPDYWSYWHAAAKGYSGVSLHLRRERFPEAPRFTHPAFDAESRIVQARCGDLVFASVYIPNGGKDYDAKVAFMKEMAGFVAGVHAAGARLVLSGDMNVARTDDDVHPSQRKPGIIGQRPEERALFEEWIARGVVDVGRQLDPTSQKLFTWWPYWRDARKRNLGWRLDYVLVSESLVARSHVVRVEYGTSDHAPVIVELDVGAR